MSLFSQHRQSMLKISEVGFTPVPRLIDDAGTLLANEALSILYHGLKKVSLCPSDHWDNVYGDLISRFAVFVQALPVSQEIDPTYYQSYGLLQQALDRAYAIGQGFQASQYKSTVFSFSHKEQALWEFALVSAGLLIELGRVALHYRVMICDEKGNKQQDWDPHSGSLDDLASGHYYRLNEIASFEAAESVSKKVTPLIARRIMPDHLFSWLASDHHVLEAWLLMLMREPTGLKGPAQSLWIHNDALQRALLDPIEFLRLEEKLRLLPIKEERDEDMVAEAKPGVEEKKTYGLQLFTENDDRRAGMSFLVWLQEKIRHGEFSKNPESGLSISEDGVAMVYPQIFQDFCKAYPRHKEWAVVYRQFNALGLSRLSGDDKVFERFFGLVSQPVADKSAEEKPALGESQQVVPVTPIVEPRDQGMERRVLLINDSKVFLEPGAVLLNPFKIPPPEAAQIYPSSGPAGAPNLTPRPPSLQYP